MYPNGKTSLYLPVPNIPKPVIMIDSAAGGGYLASFFVGSWDLPNSIMKLKLKVDQSYLGSSVDSSIDIASIKKHA